jgi:putative thioredoxin
MRDGQIVDGFVGAYPEHTVQEFVDNLLPTAEEQQIAALIAEGTEGSLRAVLATEPGNEEAIVALGELLVARGDEGDAEEALALLARIPESERTRKVAAKARVSEQVPTDDDYDATLAGLLVQVKVDDDARQRYVDILELMGPDDPRTSAYRRKLTAALY